MTLDRDAAATDALLTDLYLDALLADAVLDAAAGRANPAAPPTGPIAGSGAADPSLAIDPAARRAAERLRRDLVRVHPSFRFEERLATRLAEAAVAMRMPVAAGAEGRVVPFRAGPILDREADPAVPNGGRHDREGRGDPAPDDGRTGGGAGFARTLPGVDARPGARPLLIGGALTSAALSIAGAAFVAWRLGRPGRASTPMARAARAVRDGRVAHAPAHRGLD